MRKIIRCLITICIILGIVGCSDPDTGNVIPNEPNVTTAEDQLLNEPNEETDVIAYEGSIDGYLRNSERLRDAYISLYGVWDTGYLVSRVDMGKGVVLKYEESEFDTTNIKDGALVIVSGKATPEERSGIIEVNNLNYINPLDEDSTYYSNTAPLSDRLLSLVAGNHTVLPSAEFEGLFFTDEEGVSNLIGTNVIFYANRDDYVKLKPYTVYRMLVNNLKSDDMNHTVSADVIEYMEVQ